MMDAETVKSNINQRFDGLFYKHENGRVKPFVCVICDEILKPDEVEIVSVEKLKRSSLYSYTKCLEFCLT